MALEYKRRGKQGLLNYKADIEDTSPNSADYFNVIDIPSYLGEGKNSVRLVGSDSGLLAPNSKIDIEVLDSKGNPMYFEIPNYQAKDGSKLITIWVYSKRANRDENTPNGPATLVIMGLTRDNQIVRWTRKFEVRSDEASPSTLLFQSPNIPTATVSSSLRPFTTFKLDSSADDSLGQGRNKTLSLTTDQINVKYFASNFGDEVSLQRNTGDSDTFNGEMKDATIKLDLSNVRLYPEQRTVTQPTSFTSKHQLIYQWELQ